MEKNLLATFVKLAILTVVLVVYTFFRQRYREKRECGEAGTGWAVIHMLVLLSVIAPVCGAMFGTLVLSLFKGDLMRFCMGIWALVMFLIAYNLAFEFAEEKIGKGSRSFADSIEKVSKLESHLMNFLAVAGFYSSVVGDRLDKDTEWTLNCCLLFGAVVVFLDLVVLNIYENLYLLRGKEKPGDTQ